MTKLPKHLLPAGLLLIAEYCGDDVMWAIWQAYGGGRLSVPMSVDAEHPLAVLLGLAAAIKFCEAFGGELLNIPKAERAKRAVRDELIRTDRLAGSTLFALARKYNLTDRQIMSICSMTPQPAINFDLFENTF